MPRRGAILRARVIAWWRRSHTDPEKRAFRRVGVISFGVLGGSVVLAKIAQDAPAAGPIRAFAITMFILAAITLLAVGSSCEKKWSTRWTSRTRCGRATAA